MQLLSNVLYGPNITNIIRSGPHLNPRSHVEFDCYVPPVSFVLDQFFSLPLSFVNLPFFKSIGWTHLRIVPSLRLFNFPQNQTKKFGRKNKNIVYCYKMVSAFSSHFYIYSCTMYALDLSLQMTFVSLSLEFAEFFLLRVREQPSWCSSLVEH